MHSGLENGFSFFYILSGMAACFWGYRIFKAVIGIAGFILGAWLAVGIAVHYMGGMGIVPVIAGVAGGLIGMSLFVTMYYLGIFVLGACAGWLFGVIITGIAGSGLNIVLFAILAVVGGLMALLFQRLIIILSTAAVGAWYMTAGGFFLLGNGSDPGSMFRVRGNVIIPGSETGSVIMITWFAIAAAGAIYQFSRGRRSRETDKDD